MLPQIVQLGLDLIVSLANGIAESLPTLIPTIVDVILQIVNTLTSPEQLKNLLDAAVQLIFALSDGLMDAIPQLVDAAIQLILNLVDFLLDPENILKMYQAAFKLISSLVVGIINAIPKLVEGVVELIATVVENFKETDWGELGKNIVDGLLSGLKKAWSSLKKWFTDAWDGLVGGVKDLLGIHSPSRVFAGIGKNMALGVGEGWEDEFGDIQGDIDKSLLFDDASVGINASIRKVGAGAAGGAFGGTSIGNITINIDGAKYTDEQSLASAIALEIQNMTDRRAAVYA
jgi:phage-related protein